MASSIHVALEKISSKDKDFRYMGTSDLERELGGDSFKVDPDTERRVIHVVLQQLDDQSGDIAGIAVKCLVHLARHVPAKTGEVCSTLMEKVTKGKDAQRDIASIALKTLLQETPTGPSTQAYAVALPAKLIQGISAPAASTEVRGECLDILHEVLQRFCGGILHHSEQERLRGVLLEQLSSPKPALRKKASQSLASLAAGMPDDLLKQTMDDVVQLLKKSEGTRQEALLRSNIQAVSALSRSVGYRFGPVLPEVLPLIIRFCKQAAEHDDEVREYCLQALEAFVLRCPHDVASESGSILRLGLDFLSYDPNFMDEDQGDGDDDGARAENGDDEDEDADDEDYSDDEDMSWKVRRAAAKCVAAVIASNPDILPQIYTEASPRLIDRFREREETVKIEVFTTYTELLTQTGDAINSHRADSAAVASLLRAEVPRLVKALTRQLKEKSVKTRVGVFLVLRELVRVQPGSLSGHIALVVPGIQKALTEKGSNSALKIEALVFTRLLLTSHPAPTCQPHLKELVEPVRVCVADKYYKVTSEALRVVGEMVKVMRPPVAEAVALAVAAAGAGPAAPPTDDGFDFKPLVPVVHDAILSRLVAQDQDQEVKESAITAIALVLAILPDSLDKAKLSNALGLLLDRLRNDITRLAAVKAFSTVASSPLHPDLSSVLEPAVAELTAFLRKANRALRQSSLVSLIRIVSAYSEGMSEASFIGIISELSPLISDTDLALAALALELSCAVVGSPGVRQQCAKTVGAAANEKLQPAAFNLVKSPLLQGHALQSLQQFFVEQVGVGNTGFTALLQSLLSCGRTAATALSPSVSSAVNRAAFSSIAQCIAVLCIAAGPAQCSETVGHLYKGVKGALSSAAKQQASPGAFVGPAHGAKQQTEALLPLFTLGEIGRRADLSAQEGLQEVLLEAFSAPAEEVKSAASFCLGSIAAGNQAKFLPFILGRISSTSTDKQRQYLLLLALKEVIASGGGAVKLELSRESVGGILSLLLAHSESEEEGVRNVVAECLGKLILMDPAAVLPALKERTGSPNAFTRATVATALKFALLDAPSSATASLNSLLTPETLAPFLLLIRDSDRHVRRAAVLALGTAAHNRPQLINDTLPELLPLLYDQMPIKAELVRTVDLGPFKHEVDDGLELRKASFDCMDTLLSNRVSFHRIQPAPFISPFLVSGLADKDNDVKMTCHLILARLARRSGPAVFAVLDALLDPLERTVSRTVKKDAVKQEADRIEDMVRSALRAVEALSHISNVETSVRFKALQTKISQTPHLAALYAAVKQEGAGGKDGDGL